jgi:tripartite-type tricarboxylate transporter receptor subunit TctC
MSSRRPRLASIVLSLVSAGLCLVSAGLCLVSPAAAQEWPARPVRMVVKYSAGGGTDVLLRTLAKGMEKELGQRITVTNMTGGVGSIAAKHVADQPADGYTWLGFGNFLKHFRPMGLVDLAPWRDFETFLVGNSLASWSVPPDSPIKTFEDFIAQARANPGKLKVATDGKGGLWHEVMSFLGATLKFQVSFVTYDGGAPATLAAIQKEVDMVCSGLHEHIEFIKAGKLRNLAHFSDEDIEVPGVGVLRSITKIVPETKEMAPFGSMYGIGLRRATPKPVLMKVKAAVVAGLKDAEFDDMLKKRYFKKTLLYGKEADRRSARLEVVTANLFSALGISQKSPKDLGLPTEAGFASWWPPADYKPSAVD